MHSSAIHYIQCLRMGFCLLLTPSFLFIYFISLLERKKKTECVFLFLFTQPFGFTSEPHKEADTHNALGRTTHESDTTDHEKDEILRAVEVDDLIRFGMIPEFIGRIPVFAVFENMTTEMLIKILKEPKNALIPQYETLLEMDGVCVVPSYCNGLGFWDEIVNIYSNWIKQTLWIWYMYLLFKLIWAQMAQVSFSDLILSDVLFH